MGETVNIRVMVPGCIQNRETHAYGFRARGSFLFVLDRGIILSFWLFLNNLLLGAGLAMDAFSVSLANGLQEPYMKKRKMTLIAGVFGFFQFAMPFIGWICVNMLIGVFQFLWPLIPWISLILFCAIGGFMIKDGLTGEEEAVHSQVHMKALLLQGIATSIDALSVGFTIAEYDASDALLASLIIGITTFFICIAGLILGKTFGMKLADKAIILGGIILIAIGIEIFIG